MSISFRSRMVAGWAAGLLFCAAAPAMAQHAAHVHGSGSLLIAEEDGRLEIELVLSGADVVGFEHEPSTPAQKDAVSDAIELMKDAFAMLTPADAADCSVVSAEAHSSLEEDHASEKEQDHGHDHGTAHDHGAEKDHGDDHGTAHDHDEESHADFRAQYVLSCTKPEALTHIDVLVFQNFPTTTELSVQAITSRGQGATDLTADSNRFTF